jgi:hypothetical protein
MYVQPNKPNTKLTSYVESYVKDFRNHVRTFYSREDFFRKLSEIKNCKRKDEEFSLKRELRDMLRARGLDMKKFLINGDNLDIESLEKALQVIPLQKELKFIFIKKLYEIFKAFPTPENFMFRLIRHFTKDEFSNDSLRMQILKMFIRNTNYHTDTLINRVVEKFSSDERNSYEVLDSFNKRECIINCLTEEIFSDDINFAAWLDFVCRWFDKFDKPQEELGLQLIPETKDMEICLAHIEKEFYEFLLKFNLVENGKIVSSRGAQFKQEKISWIIEKADIFEALGIDYIGQSFFNLKEYTDFIWKQFSLLDAKTIFIVEQRVSSEAKIHLKKLVHSLEIKIIDETVTIIDLLKFIATSKNERINSNIGRTAVIESVEREFLGLNLFPLKCYRKSKSIQLIRLHEKLIEKKLKSNWQGLCGLELEMWKEFLLRKLNDCKPPAEFSFSKIVTFTLRKLLNSSDFHDLSGIKLLKSLQEGLIADRSFSVNKLTSRANREIVEYLKQFRHESQKSFGHIFNRALKDSTKFSTDMTLPNLAQDLAESIMKAHGVTKFQLYLLAFALNLNRDEFIKMLSDIYQDNFLRHINDSQRKTTRHRKNDTASFLCGESINYKNYVETILLYFLCKSTSRDRLDHALKMIEHCFYVVRKKAKALNTDCKISSVLNNTNKLTKDYVDEFENILSFSEKEFEKYIVSNFHIYEPLAPLSNSRIMMNAENNTARKYFLKLADVAETLMDAEYGVDIEWLISELRESDDREVQKILKDERFLKVLRKLDDTLHIERRDLLDSELLKSRKFFTRTDLIALYYFVFVNTVLNDAIASYQITDVETLYDDFVYGNLMQDQGLDFSLHESLSECKFHSLSVTSIYDQFILFYLYLKVIF